jgi:hypothetical protein
LSFIIFTQKVHFIINFLVDFEDNEDVEKLSIKTDYLQKIAFNSFGVNTRRKEDNRWKWVGKCMGMTAGAEHVERVKEYLCSGGAEAGLNEKKPAAST